MSPYRPWLVACVAAAIFFLMPLAFITATVSQQPEIRIAYGEARTDAFSALVVTGEVRILMINSTDRRTARSIIGTLARPWEPPYSVVIAPAGDQTFAGVHEAVRNPAITQVIIVGIPGANPEWTALERELANRDIDLHYAGGPVEINPEPLQMTIQPGGQDAHIIVRNGQAVVLLALGVQTPPFPAHLTVANQTPESHGEVDLVMLALAVEFSGGTVGVERSKRMTVTLLEQRIEIEGWKHLSEDSDAN